MTKTYDIIHLPDGYMYAVDNKKIPYNPNGGTNGLFICLSEINMGHPEDAFVKNVGNCEGCRTIITTNNPTLGLPLLSEIEEDVEQLAKDRATALFPVGTSDVHWRACVEDFLMGYKAAKAKQYTEEDMRNAFNSGQICEYEGAYDKDSWFNGFISTLNPKPIAVEIEMIYDYSDMEEHCEGGTLPSAVYGELQLKLTNNNEVIVKQWIYE